MMRASAARLLAAALLCGCASYRTQRVGVIAPWPLESEPLLGRVELRLYGNLRYEGGPAEMDVERLALWRDQALRAYSESGIFAGVASDWNSGDVVAEIGFIVRTIAPKAESSADVLAYQSCDLVMRTQFRDRSGHSLGSIDVNETVRSYTNILLLPFSSPSDSGRVARQVIYDLHRATLKRARAQGILRAAGAKGEAAAPEEHEE